MINLRTLLSPEQLGDASQVADAIRAVGLRQDARGIYGSDGQYMREDRRTGLYQHPEELAAFLVHLRKRIIETGIGLYRYTDIGTFNGWTSSFIYQYLRMSQDEAEIEVTVVEPDRHWDDRYKELKAAGLLNVVKRHHAVDEIEDPASGLVFIDGLHEFSACWNDYIQTQRARFVAFHDIADSYVQKLPEEGVVGVWKKIKAKHPEKCTEFLNGVIDPRVMGIGVVER